MDALYGFILAALALTGSPGPNVLSLAATGAAFGARSGLVYMAGLIAGMVVVMSVVASGLTGVVLALPGARPVVTAMAAGYILYLAFRIATAPPLVAAGESARRPGFASGVWLSLLNPKAYAAMAALFSGFVLMEDRPLLDTGLKIALLVAIVTLVSTGWLFAGAALARLFRTPRLSRALNLAFAALLVVSVALALLL